MRAWKEAESLAAAGRWAEAGDAFLALARRAVRVKDRGAAWRAASLAGDAFRRDDRPAAAAKALAVALAQGADAAVDRVQLAAVLLDAGRIVAARDVAGGVPARASDPGERVLALDTLLGLELAAGEVEAARGRLAELEATDLPGAAVARAFRRAQIDRLDGLLGEADAAFAAVVAQLAPYPQAAGPVGGAWGERGEIAALRAGIARAAGLQADPGAAPACFDEAGRAWAAAGRRAGVLRAEAWNARVRAEAGEEVLGADVARAVAYAEERGMAVLEAELRVCLAVVRRDPGEAERATAALDEAPFARGRARVVAGELGGPFDAARALGELRGDAPWAVRARLLHARRSGDRGLFTRVAEEAAALR